MSHEHLLKRGRLDHTLLIDRNFNDAATPQHGTSSLAHAGMLNRGDGHDSIRRQTFCQPGKKHVI